jgi:hypothetical protein
MLNDWCEMPDDAVSGALRRAALESCRDASAAAVTTVDGGEAGHSLEPDEADHRVDGRAPAGAPITVTETDVLYWFG